MPIDNILTIIMCNINPKGRPCPPLSFLCICNYILDIRLSGETVKETVSWLETFIQTVRIRNFLVNFQISLPLVVR